MRRKGNLTQIFQLDVHFAVFQSQSKDVPDIDITSILRILKTWNPYLTKFITTSQIVLKLHTITYKYF